MRTGEGKTLVATLPSYLNALSGHGVHIVITVNDYLASLPRRVDGRRSTDSSGSAVGKILHGLSDAQRQDRLRLATSRMPPTTSSRFDYLRDNMKLDLERLRPARPALRIVDEVDSILIDEARTPLIISGAVRESTRRSTRCQPA